jgi:hypothetical protein
MATLARLYFQTLVLSLAFAGTGGFLHDKLFGRQSADRARARRPAEGLDAGSAFFVGLSAFLAALILLSHVAGARVALWITLALMIAAAAQHWWTTRIDVRRSVWFLASLLLLVAFYSATNLALWLERHGGMTTGTATIEPGIFTHFGSIHSGRYANYAILIAQSNRVPRLAQDMGQSILASAHLMLGTDSPLGGLMVWVPFSLAFLTILFYSRFRAAPYPRGPCLAATFLVMFCNVAVSLVHVLVFDNGSPLAFIGYTDMIAAVGTFIVLCRWFADELTMKEPGPSLGLLLPVLFGAAWSWYAPENLVLAALSFVAAAFVCRRSLPAPQTRNRLGKTCAALALGLSVGATQAGPFLPAALREYTGLWTQPLEAANFAIRPYAMFLTGHWTIAQWNVPTDNLPIRMYEHAYEQARVVGIDLVYRRLAWLFEEQLWSSLRVYGSPLIGIGLLAACLRRRPVRDSARYPAERSGLILSACSFGFGYAIYFNVELGEMKWWLTRFLVPGSAMAFVCLGLGVLESLQPRSSAVRRALWVLLLGVATVGPVSELLSGGVRNVASRVDPIDRRLALLVHSKGPYLFEALNVQPEAASPARGGYQVGGPGKQQGLAIYSPAVFLKAGRHEVGYSIRLPHSPGANSSLLTLDATLQRGGVVIARRSVTPDDLDRREDGAWAWLEIALPRDAPDVQFRLWNASAEGFEVQAMRFERP